MNHFYKILYLSLINVFLIGFTGVSQTKVELLSYKSSECKEVFDENLYKLQDRIIAINKTDDFHVFDVFVVTNCSGTEQGEIKFKNDTLKLVFHATRECRIIREKNNNSPDIIIEECIEEEADCDCAFNLSYKIKGLANKDYIITANGKKIIETEHKFKIKRKKPSFEIIDNDTINTIDIYGLKQGLHIKNKKDGRLLSKIVYKNGEKISGLVNVFYDFDGFYRIETYIQNKKYTKRKYYNKERLIKICDTRGGFEEGTNCIYEKE